MTDCCVERASARTGEVCPSDFGRVAVAIDEAEAISWDRDGGPSDDDIEAIRLLEIRLYNLRPVNLHDVQWLARRLARALDNGWHEGAFKPLLRLTV